MYDREERVDKPPPVGVPKDLAESVERLKWIRKSLNDCQSLPDGKLRQSILERLSVLLGDAPTFEGEIAKLKDELKSSQEETVRLEKALDQQVQDQTSAPTREDRQMISRLTVSVTRWRKACFFLVVAILIILKLLQ